MQASAAEVEIANELAASDLFSADPVEAYHNLLARVDQQAAHRIWRIATKIWERDKKGGE